MDDKKRLYFGNSLNQLLKIGFGIIGSDSLESITDMERKELGTTADETTSSFVQLRELMARKKEQIKQGVATTHSNSLPKNK